METTFQFSYPRNSENARPFGTRTVYLSCAAKAMPPKTASTAPSAAAAEATLKPRERGEGFSNMKFLLMDAFGTMAFSKARLSRIRSLILNRQLSNWIKISQAYCNEL